MYYDIETKVYQDDKGIFIKRANGDSAPKYDSDGEIPVCAFSIAKGWEIIIRCDYLHNAFLVQLRENGRVHQELHPATLDELNNYALPWCFQHYYNQLSFQARKKYTGSFGVANAAGDGMLLLISSLILIAVADYFGGVLGAIIGILVSLAIANIVGDTVRSEAEAAGYYKGMAASIARRFQLNEPKKAPEAQEEGDWKDSSELQPE
ncbi:hypothetical protein SAMN05216584_108114 [Selenomonas sp. WCT3]|uniref:hypothetical protein n=1 Tax=Selenomonas sp. WCT3 TaxID=3158785 RepID=UPI000886F06A|nr:hypothetical protein SAMN05216584_108114 [Selenomonas ruminantium]